MPTFSETDIRSLVSLLDDEDPRNLDLVQREILDLGEAAIPFLEELHGRRDHELAARADSLARQLHFRGLRQAFQELAASRAPDLEQGVWLIARFGYPGADCAAGSALLDTLAEQVRGSLPPTARPEQTLQSLNHRFFDVWGFCGNEQRYYDPDNSYINRVIETRRGIPVSLAVIYLLVAKRLSLPAFGVATPGHFLVGLRLGPQASYLDAYNRGRALGLADVQRMLARSGYAFRPEFLAPAGSRDILIRMMRNLIAIYQKAAQTDRTDMLSRLVDILLTGRPAQPAATQP